MKKSPKPTQQRRLKKTEISGRDTPKQQFQPVSHSYCDLGNELPATREQMPGREYRETNQDTLL